MLAGIFGSSIRIYFKFLPYAGTISILHATEKENIRAVFGE